MLAGSVSAAVVLPWLVWVAVRRDNVPAVLRGAHGSCGDWLGEAFRRDGFGLVARTISATSPMALSVVLDAIDPDATTALRAVLLVFLFAVTLAGTRELRRRAPAVLWFVALYLAMMLLWPVQPARYVWGVWPLLLLPFVLGVRATWRWRPQSIAARSARAALVAGVVILTAGYARQTVRGVRGRYWQNIPRTGGALLRPIILGVRATTTPDEIVAAPAEVSTYLCTGRRTVPIYTYPVQQLFRKATDAGAACALGEILTRYPASVLVSDDPQQEQTAVGLAAMSGVRFVERARLANDVVVYTVARSSRPLACLPTD